MRRIESVLLVSLLLLGGQSDAPTSQPSSSAPPPIIVDQAYSLVGLKRFYVQIEADQDTKDALKASNLSTDLQLAQTEAEMELRKLGITVVGPEKCAFGLEIDITAHPYPGGLCPYVVTAKFNRITYLDNQQPMLGPTWNSFMYGACQLLDVTGNAKSAAHDLVQQFANDYLKANPIKQP